MEVDPNKKEEPKDAGSQSPAGDSVESLKQRLAALENEKKEWQSQKEKDMSLNDKVRLERENLDKKSSETKHLEDALTFNLTSNEFLKSNESVLPKEIGDIFKAADKEKYDSAISKANATKSAIVQSFFSQQANVDLLTPSQKLVLDDYYKLTKNGKEEKAKEIYDNLFEPALSSIKRVKKAEELSRSKLGYRDGKGDSQYKEKLMSLSKKHFLGKEQ